MRLWLLLMLAPVLSGCIPIGVRAGTMPGAVHGHPVPATVPFDDRHRAGVAISPDYGAQLP